MNSSRIGFRRPRGFDRSGGGRRVPPPQGGSDRTVLFVSLGLGLAALVLVFVVFGGSSGSAPEGRDQSADLSLKEAIEAAQKIAGKGNLPAGLDLLEAALRDPAHRSSQLLPQCRNLAEEYRKQIAFEKEAAEAIDAFKRKVDASKADQTAMKKAREFWDESSILLDKFGATLPSKIVRDIREDLRRWLATGSQDVWQEDYNRTKARIQKQHLDTGNFKDAAREWRHFEELFSDPLVKSRVESELRTIDIQSREAARKIVESAGTGPLARQKLETEMEKFVGTEGHKIIKDQLAKTQ
ncbi:MAG TPA: hypothetical protein VK661_13555 [Planctomycetota bacterium]|nr:hypothetical protein [Planctomycetota bacterium]